jgi:hypothetical protein
MCRIGLLIIAAAIASCAYAGTDDLKGKGTLRTLSYRGQPAVLAECLTTELDRSDVSGIKVTRSRTLADGSVELQAGHYGAPQVLEWMAVLSAASPAQTRVDLTTRNFAYITMSGDDIAARVQQVLSVCTPKA